MYIHLNMPRTAGRRVARMDLTVRAWVAQETQTVRYPFNQTVSQKTASVAWTVSWDVGNPDAPQVKVRFDRGSVQPPTWQDMAAFLSVSRISLIDDNGVAWSTDTSRNNGNYQDDQMTITRTFQRPAQPAGQPAPSTKSQPVAAVIEFPTAVKPIVLQYNFSDIPVP